MIEPNKIFTNLAYKKEKKEVSKNLEEIYFISTFCELQAEAESIGRIPHASKRFYDHNCIKRKIP